MWDTIRKVFGVSPAVRTINGDALGPEGEDPKTLEKRQRLADAARRAGAVVPNAEPPRPVLSKRPEALTQADKDTCRVSADVAITPPVDAEPATLLPPRDDRPTLRAAAAVDELTYARPSIAQPTRHVLEQIRENAREALRLANDLEAALEADAEEQERIAALLAAIQTRHSPARTGSQGTGATRPSAEAHHVHDDAEGE